MQAIIHTKTVEVIAVVTAEMDMATVLKPGQTFMLVSTTNAWFKQGTAPIAASAAVNAVDGAGSQYLPANVPMLVSGDNGATISIIRDSADGKAALARVTV